MTNGEYRDSDCSLFSPGIAFYLSSFYKRKELYFRVGIYVSAASIAGAFGGLLAAGFSQIPEWGIAGSRLRELDSIPCRTYGLHY